MNIEKLEFPSEIENTLRKRIRQTIKMTFYAGAKINVNTFNLAILETYKILFKKGQKIILVYITENTKDLSKGRYNYFINAIAKETKHSLNQLINIVNNNL